MLQMSPGRTSVLFEYEQEDMLEMWMLSINIEDVDALVALVVEVVGMDIVIDVPIDDISIDDIDIDIDMDMDMFIDIPPPMYAGVAPYVAMLSHTSVPFLLMLICVPPSCKWLPIKTTLPLISLTQSGLVYSNG